MPETKATAGQCLGSGLTRNGSLGSDTSGNKKQRNSDTPRLQQ